MGNYNLFSTRFHLYRRSSKKETQPSMTSTSSSSSSSSSLFSSGQYTHVCILDFEATTGKGIREIIQFPSILCKIMEDGSLEEVSSFDVYVTPAERPTLSSFCTDLTGITQEMVRQGMYLEQALREHVFWIMKHVVPSKVIPLTCGDWDLEEQLPSECARKKISRPGYLKRWINIQEIYKAVATMDERSRGSGGKGMTAMLKGLQLELVGKHHNGFDDCRNVQRICNTLLPRLASLEAPQNQLESRQDDATLRSFCKVNIMS
jgi:ERI1 exoribonuclease 3